MLTRTSMTQGRIIPLFCTITTTSQATSMARESKAKRKATNLRNPQEEDALKKRKEPKIRPTHGSNSTLSNHPTTGASANWGQLGVKHSCEWENDASIFLISNLSHWCPTKNGAGVGQEASHFLVVISPFIESHKPVDILADKHKGANVVKRKKEDNWLLVKRLLLTVPQCVQGKKVMALSPEN